ncbi:MAG TPA: ankyrin repeat domain-containing protein [Blastocatellia bacterium]|nr:ankyrin repeat domain-containing protein [Blastocatellia bacterium]
MRLKAIVLILITAALFTACASSQEPVGTTPAPAPASPPPPPSDIRDQDGRTQLMRTVETSDVTEVEKIINAGANVNEQSYTGITALQTAAGMGKTDIVRLLIRKGADVNQKAQGGFTPLMQAALAGRTEVAEILLEAGADPDAAETVTGKTAADWADEKNHKEIVQMLVRHGARQPKKR